MDRKVKPQCQQLSGTCPTLRSGVWGSCFLPWVEICIFCPPTVGHVRNFLPVAVTGENMINLKEVPSDSALSPQEFASFRSWCSDSHRLSAGLFSSYKALKTNYQSKFRLVFQTRHVSQAGRLSSFS